MINTRNIILLITLSLIIGLATSIQIYLPILIIGITIYILFLIYFNDYSWFKKILPYFLVVIIFQDLLTSILEPLNSVFGTIISSLDELFIVIFLPIVIYNNFNNKRFKFDFTFIAFIIIVLLGLVSSITHSVPFGITLQGLFLMLKGIVIFFIFRSVPFSEEDLNRYIKIVKVIAVIIVIFAGIDLLFYMPFRNLLHTNNFIDVRAGIVSVQSLFIHPGVYGWFMAMVGLYCLAKYTVKDDRKFGVYTILFFLAAMLSFRFKVVITLMTTYLFSFLKLGYKKMLGRIFWVILFTTLGYYLIGDEIIELANLTVDRYIEASYLDSARKALYIVGYQIAMNEFPFGVGFGRYGGFIARTNYSPVYYEYGLDRVYGLRPDDPKWATDTYWPHIIGEIGLLGGIVLLAVFVYFCVYLLRAYKVESNISRKVFYLFAVLIIIQGIIESTGEQIFNSAPGYIFIFGITGMAFSLIQEKTNKTIQSS
ncbi:MAG: hypothetical protein ACQEWV_20905 [Bacillota bacterium]